MTPQLIDAKKAALLLDLPPSWLLTEARCNRVPHVRFGRYVRFNPDHLDAWWRSREKGPVREVPRGS